MADLLYTEILKLKRSRIFILSFFGSALAPFLVVAASYIYLNSVAQPEPIDFRKLFEDTNLYSVLLVGVPLYGVVTAYLFNREYAEDTLKNLLTIPVSRTAYIMSKMLLLYLWMLALTISGWMLVLVLGLLGQFDGLSASLLLVTFLRAVSAGTFLFILSTPIVLVTIVLRSFVPAIILAISITLVNTLGYNSEYRGLIPWTAAFDISNGTLLPKFPMYVSCLIIAAVSLAGLAAAVAYFRRMDVS